MLHHGVVNPPSCPRPIRGWSPSSTGVVGGGCHDKNNACLYGRDLGGQTQEHGRGFSLAEHDPDHNLLWLTESSSASYWWLQSSAACDKVNWCLISVNKWPYTVQCSALKIVIKLTDLIFCSVIGGYQGGTTSASGSNHWFLRPLPRSGAETGILPGSGPLPPLHRPLSTAAACHLWFAPPGHADPHRPFQSHI